jgi:hypothetical protein
LQIQVLALGHDAHHQEFIISVTKASTLVIKIELRIA